MNPWSVPCDQALGTSKLLAARAAKPFGASMEGPSMPAPPWGLPLPELPLPEVFEMIPPGIGCVHRDTGRGLW